MTKYILGIICPVCGMEGEITTLIPYDKCTDRCDHCNSPINIVSVIETTVDSDKIIGETYEPERNT